jgi:hypothetical protein
MNRRGPHDLKDLGSMQDCHDPHDNQQNDESWHDRQHGFPLQPVISW